MNVIQSQTSEGNYRWLLTPGNGPKLEGRPWDAVKRPRLKLIDNRPDSSKGVPPIVRVEVQCLREDLVIEGLELKDEALFEKVKNRLGFNNRMAAAVSYIRDRLRAENLEVENIDEAFARLTLGSMAAQSIS
jgi:hypothetical protein